MKKLILLLFAIILSNCEIKPRESKADYFNENYSSRKVIVDNIEYIVFYADKNYSRTSNAIAVMNLTKDKLEIELLKKQLAK